LPYDDQVGVPVAVQIGRQKLSRTGASLDTRHNGETTKTAIQVIAEKLVRAVRIDHKNVQVAVMIGIDQSGVAAVTGIVGTGLRSRLCPGAVGCAQP